MSVWLRTAMGSWERAPGCGFELHEKSADGRSRSGFESLFFSFFFFFFFFLSFLGPLSWHMEVPRLGVESEL